MEELYFEVHLDRGLIDAMARFLERMPFHAGQSVDLEHCLEERRVGCRSARSDTSDDLVQWNICVLQSFNHCLLRHAHCGDGSRVGLRQAQRQSVDEHADDWEELI